MAEQNTQQPTPGAMVLKEVGGFEIIAKVGQGGMGAVFKARQKSLDRIVALKILPPNIARDKAFIERFVREARASARLTHPHVVAGIDVGQDTKTGLWYFAMEFVDGPTARQLLQQQGKLPEDQALRIARDIAGALDCAHQNGMVHRDVKPDNILLTTSGSAKLADLGLARHANDDAHLTQSGTAMGTPFYMAPEQVRGEVDHLDTRADLYALGGTLFHLVTGQPPFQGATSALIMAKHLSDPPPMANRICSDVSAGCSRLILKLMQKEKTQRIQTPQELIEQIERLLKLPAAARGLTTGPRIPIRGATTTAPRDAIRPRLSPQTEPATAPRNQAVLYAGLGAGAVLLLGLAAFLLIPSNNKPAPRTHAPVPVTPAVQPRLATDTLPRPDPVTTKALAPQEPPLERHWREAKGFAAARPNDFDEILRRYRKVALSASGSPLAAEIEAEITAVEQQSEAAAKEAATSLEKRIAEAVAGGDYDTALAACRDLPPALAKTLSEQMESRRATLNEEAVGKIQPVLEKANAASADADPATGLKLLESIASLKFQPMTEDVQQLKRRLETELANVDELKARKAQREAQKKLAQILDRFDAAFLEAKDESAAARIAKEARGATDLEPVRAQADALVAILDAGNAERKRQEEALTLLKGRPFAVGKDQGTIERVVDGALYVKISLGGGKVTATKTFKIAELPQAQRDELFPPIQQMPDALRVEQALCKMVKGQEDFVAAGALLSAAPDFPLTPHYLELIQSRKAAVMETEAQKAWIELVAEAEKPIQKPEQAVPVFEKLTAFFNAFGQTAFATEHVDEMSALRSKLEQIANPNYIRNGGFESGTLDGWTVAVDKPENAQLVADTFHGGKSSVRLARGSISQIVQLTPGETYEASCWVKRADWAGGVTFNIDDSRDPQTCRRSALNEITGWIRFSIVFTAQKPSYKIGVALVTLPSLNGAAYIDDLSVAKPSAAATTTAKATVPPDAVHFGGHAYKVFPAALPFATARQRCEEMGGHLVTVNSEPEFDFVRGIMKEAKQQLWLGLSKQGEQWGWVTGEPLQTNYWHTGKPGGGTVARMMQDTAKWNACNDRPFGFICEWDTTNDAPVTADAKKETPVLPAAQTPAAAQFVGEDARTQGKWKKFYGKDGHIIQGDETALPPYAQFSCSGSTYLWEKRPAESRALDRVLGGKVAACWYTKDTPMRCDLNLTDGREHTVAIYMLDWRDRGNPVKVEMLDAASGRTLDTQNVSAISQGKYLVYRIRGTVQIRLTGAYTYISGVFFQ